MASVYPFMDINLHASDSRYAFLSPSNPKAPTLIIERPSGDIRLTEGKVTGAKRVSSIGGILGIIKLRLDKYVIVITKSKPVGKLRGATVHKILATELLPLRERPLHDPDENGYLSLLRHILRSGPMYFSYGIDLTNSSQRQAKCDPAQPLWQRADDRFFWNKFISSDMMDFRAGTMGSSGIKTYGGDTKAIDPYILPVISGMCSIHQTTLKGTPFIFALLTRRSRYRTGTRYFSRGIDEFGHVSNFNETEQLLLLNDDQMNPAGGFGSTSGSVKSPRTGDTQILSYVQTRGSVPVYWAEVNKLKYTPELQVRGVDSAMDAAKLHFEEQIRVYGENYMVNLVNQKGREKGVKDAYEQMVRQLQSASTVVKGEDSRTSEPVHMLESTASQQQFDRLHYVYFDFHNETKGLKWHRTQILLDQLNPALLKHQYFYGVSSLGDKQGRTETRSLQKGVVRTNCMDCLDRTNVVQSMIGRHVLNRMLQDVHVLSRGEKAEDDANFENLFRNTWADNADAVSISYSGTGALKTDFTRTGSRTNIGALQDAKNSIVRYFRNNFADGPRQDAYDLFTGAFLPSNFSVSGAFADTRPISVQAMPYIFVASLFLLSVGTATRPSSDSSLWPLRVILMLSLALGLYCINFIASHGMLYVAWPKLNTPQWALEGYNDALIGARRDPIVGSFVRHGSTHSESKMTYLEEGKKRVE